MAKDIPDHLHFDKAGDSITYTCPMHPEIRQQGPGVCPKCGMALEPVTFDMDDKNEELTAMNRRFRVCLVLTLPAFILVMTADLAPALLPVRLGMHEIQWIEFILTAPVVLWGGWPFFVRGWLSVVTLNLNMFTLIALGVSAAWIYSFTALFFPQIFPPLMQTGDGLADVYFESAAVIVTLVLLGQVLELRARSGTGMAIKLLLGLAPHAARIVRDDGTEEDITLESVKPGDMLRIRPGEKVPVDGIITEGESYIDESMVTGDPVPVARTSGKKIIGATINTTGTLLMRAEKVGADTMLAQIVDMVAQAQRSRAPIQRLADVVSGYFVPVVIGIAIISFMLWRVWGPEPRLALAFTNAVAVLIIACPCALGLATPISIMVGTGRGAMAGVLIKNAGALQVMEKVDTLVVDKTGTLTEGRPELAMVKALNGLKEDEILRLAASLESASEHPLSRAIVNGAQAKGIELLKTERFLSFTGKGVTGELNGHAVASGNLKLFESLGIDADGLVEKAEKYHLEGQTVIMIGIDGKASGFIGITDPIKDFAPEAIRKLHEEGLRIVMLTGDSFSAAKAVSDKLGLDGIHADTLPEQKADIIKRLQAEGHIIAMAGDGINDAPALLQADIGIAMGTGTDVAKESADITLVKGDLRGIIRARRLSRSVMSNIRENLFFAFIYNSAGIPVAAGILYPFSGMHLSPVIAAAAMSLSSVSVIVNALRLRRVKL